MKLVLIALCTAPLAALPFTPAGQPGQDAAPAVAHDEDPLVVAMESMEDALGKLRRAVRDEATIPDALAALADLEAATVASKNHAPPMAAGLPEAERAAFVRDYKKMLIALLQAELACETALLDGDLEGAQEAFKRVRAFEDDGHERFTEE